MNDERIEEYKTLREEILRKFEAMEKNLIACITTNGVALAYGINQSQPFVLILAALIPVYFWIEHTNYRNAIAKVASYIAVFLEGKETNLMWERRVHGVDAKHHRFRISYFMRTLFLPYPVIFLISIIISAWKMKPTNAPLWSVLVVLSGIALITLVIARRADVPYTKLREQWLSLFKQIKAEEESSPKTTTFTELSSSVVKQESG